MGIQIQIVQMGTENLEKIEGKRDTNSLDGWQKVCDFCPSVSNVIGS